MKKLKTDLGERLFGMREKRRTKNTFISFVRIIAYKKDGHFQRKIEKLNHYLTKNQIGFILKSIFENRKTYWIIESAKNERTSY